MPIPEMMDKEQMSVVYAGTVKALGDGLIRGPLYLYGDAKTTDLVKDYFTRDTDPGIHQQYPVYYQHGMDRVLGAKRLAIATRIEAKAEDDFALWAEYQLDLTDKYSAFLYDRAEEGKMGHSTGAVGHLVQRVQKANGASWVKSWPIGELSLTPEPAEPRMIGQVVPLKTVTVSDIWDAELISNYETTKTGRVLIPVDIDVTITKREAETMAEDNKQVPGQGAEAVTTDDLKSLFESFQKSLTNIKTELSAELDEKVKAWEPEREVHKSVNVNTKYKRGVSFDEAFQAWACRGDEGAMHEYRSGQEEEWNPVNGTASQKALHVGDMISLKASNATAMIGGTDAAGGHAVPTGHVNNINARRDDDMLTAKLGVTRVPGQGLTVNHPVDNEANGIWVSTAERAANDMDSPALKNVAFTLTTYTKRVPISDQLAQDEASGLMSFLEDFVGRGLAKTHNNLLIAEVGNSGTAFISFASSIAIAFGEPEDIMGDVDLSNYLDDSSSVAWVTRSNTYWGSIVQIVNTSIRTYAPHTQGNQAGPTLLGHDVHFSTEVTSIGAQANPNAKALYFGNWSYVGTRLDPEFRVLRDPYSEASRASVNLHYYMRTAYRVLQGEAIGYGVGLDV